MSDHDPRFVVLVQNNERGCEVARVLDTWYSWREVVCLAGSNSRAGEATRDARALAASFNAEHDAWLAAA